MGKLELKHLVCYLPYGAMFQSSMDKPFDEFGKQPIWHIEGVIKLFGNYCLTTKNNNDAYEISSCRLILRPLSDLTKEIEHNGEKFVPNEYLKANYVGEMIGVNIATWSHRVVGKLSEWHFDWQGLINKGLAVDINTLNQ